MGYTRPKQGLHVSITRATRVQNMGCTCPKQGLHVSKTRATRAQNTDVCDPIRKEYPQAIYPPHSRKCETQRSRQQPATQATCRDCCGEVGVGSPLRSPRMRTRILRSTHMRDRILPAHSSALDESAHDHKKQNTQTQKKITAGHAESNVEPNTHTAHAYGRHHRHHISTPIHTHTHTHATPQRERPCDRGILPP
jgi:hypothetical protein